MVPKYTTDELPAKYDWLSDAETLVVDAEALVKWHLKNPHVCNKRILKVSPSWGKTKECVRGRIRSDPDGYYVGDNHPLHIGIDKFFEEPRMSKPTRAETRDAIKNNIDGELTEKKLDREHEKAMEIYRQELRKRIKDEINLFKKHKKIVSIETV